MEIISVDSTPILTTIANTGVITTTTTKKRHHLKKKKNSKKKHKSSSSSDGCGGSNSVNYLEDSTQKNDEDDSAHIKSENRENLIYYYLSFLTQLDKNLKHSDVIFI